MQLTPRAVYRRVLGTWLLFLTLLVTALSIDTGDESPTAAVQILPTISLGISEPSRFEPQIRTWNNAFVGILVPAAVLVLVLLAAHAVSQTLLLQAQIESLIAKAVDQYNRGSFKNGLPVSKLSSGLRWTAELATRFFNALAAHLIEIEFVPGRILTSRPALNERFDRCQDKASANLPVFSPTSAQLERAGKLEDLPSEPRLVLSPLLEEEEDQFWRGNATCYPLPSDSQVGCESVQGYMLDFTERCQAEEEVSMGHSEPADVSPDIDTHHPAVAPSHHSLESSTATPKHAIEDESLSFGHLFQNDDDGSEYDEEELLAPIKHCSFKFPATHLQVDQPRCVPASQVSYHPDSVRVDKKAEEGPSALDPQACEPSGTGIGDLTAQVSGTPIPDAGSIGAHRLGFASSKPRNPDDFDADLSAQVSGTASKTGFLRKLRVKVKAAVASTKRSRVIVQANLDRIKNAGKRGFKSSSRKKGKAAVPDLSDSESTLPFDAPAPTASLPAEDAEETEKKPKKVVRFSNVVQIREAPRSVFDELARTRFESKRAEREIEQAYRTWSKGKWREQESDDLGDISGDDEDLDEDGFSKQEQEEAKAESRRGGGLALYGASTSRDSSRPFSEEEWEELEQYQSVRSGTTEAVQPQPELPLTEPEFDIVYKMLLELEEHPTPTGTIQATANERRSATTKRAWRRLRRVVSSFLC